MDHAALKDGEGADVVAHDGAKVKNHLYPRQDYALDYTMFKFGLTIHGRPMDPGVLATAIADRAGARKRHLEEESKEEAAAQKTAKEQAKRQSESQGGGRNKRPKAN